MPWTARRTWTEMSAEICEYLEWDSTFFGIRIGRFTGETMTEDQASAALRWCESNRIACLYLLTGSNDAPTVAAAHSNGFEFVDIRVTLECEQSAESGATSPAVRPFRTSDGVRLSEIASVSHYDSRFYYDSRFPRDRSDALFATW